MNAQNVTPSAATAAATAFLSHRGSSASLSSAAAAAALRSRPTTPTSVADVQTKRTVRRNGSVSSVGSAMSGAGGGGGRPNLERRGSSGSMSERTFRDPSPNRSAAVPSAADAPPVPAIPKNIKPPVPAKSHRRTASMEAPAMRVASPPPSKVTGRGSSLGPARGTLAPPGRSTQRISSLTSVQEFERPESRGSVNFSYPTNARAMSPMGERRLTSPMGQRMSSRPASAQSNTNMVYDPNTRSFLPAWQVMNIEQEIQDVANKTVKKKKKLVPNGAAAGTHLAAGTSNGRPQGTAVDAMRSQTASPSPRVKSPEPIAPAATVPKKTKKKAVMNDTFDDSGNNTPLASDNENESGSLKGFNTRAGALLAKKPSVVREEPQREEEEDDSRVYNSRQAALNVLEAGKPDDRSVSPSPLPRGSAASARGNGRGGRASASAAFAQERQQIRSASQPPLEPTDTIGTAGRGQVSKRGSRVASVSPARNARFLSTPESFGGRHDPPPRSLSPMKSALKNSPSSRQPSPAGDTSGSNGRVAAKALSEASDASTVVDDRSARKKQVRVSFDDANTVVLGTAATPVAGDSPISQGSQAKDARSRGWFNIGGRKKRDSVTDDEDDTVMKPRPALPSFGSVREKKSREFDNTPTTTSTPIIPIPTSLADVLDLPQPSPLFTTPTGEVIEHPDGLSFDNAVGAVLANDQATKNAATTSKSREPLPPQVTSVEGSGYHSDSDSSYDSMGEAQKSSIEIARGVEQDHRPAATHVEAYRALASPILEQDEDQHMFEERDGNVPSISLVQATPVLESTGGAWPDVSGESKGPVEWPDMPGGFPPGSSDSGSHRPSPQIVAHHHTDPTPAGLGIAEPVPDDVPAPGSPAIGAIATENLQHHVIAEEDEASDEDSIYSDAAEDLDDLEGDGFLSLNAVADSPIVKFPAALGTSAMPESPTARSVKEKAYRNGQLSRKTSEPDMDEGWDKAQQYWSGLTAEKKRALERAAREKSDSDTDVFQEEAEKPKPLAIAAKKKKVAVPAPAVTDTGRREPQVAVARDRTYQITPGAKHEGTVTSMRSSMRGPSPNTANDNHIRKSMRDGASSGGGSMRASMRGPTPAGPQASSQKKARAVSYQPAQERSVNGAAKHTRNLSASAAAASASPAAVKMATAAAPPLRRRGSGDSDSSFKRSKPAADSVNMRRSMRGSMQTQQPPQPARPQSPDSPASNMRSSRFSIRSLSPTGSILRRPFNSGASTGAGAVPSPSKGQSTLRGFRRNSVESDSQSIRSTSRGMFSKQKPAPAPSSFRKTAPKRNSRFADSDSDEEPRRGFRSRFADSDSDSDGGATQLPRRQLGSTLRSIPQKSGVEDGDSSDLPDSDVETRSRLPTKPAKNGVASTASTAKKEGSTLASGSLRRSGSGRDFTTSTGAPLASPITAMRPEQKRRGSFMSILRRKRDPSAGVQKFTPESGARMDTPLERSRSDLAAVRNNSYVSMNGQTQSPRLQKRPTGISRAGSESWPLPAVPPIGAVDGRPATSDGGMANGSSRPPMSRRATTEGSVILGRNGKKKRFVFLRKALGIHD